MKGLIDDYAAAFSREYANDVRCKCRSLVDNHLAQKEGWLTKEKRLTSALCKR